MKYLTIKIPNLPFLNPNQNQNPIPISASYIFFFLSASYLLPPSSTTIICDSSKCENHLTDSSAASICKDFHHRFEKSAIHLTTTFDLDLNLRFT